MPLLQLYVVGDSPRGIVTEAGRSFVGSRGPRRSPGHFDPASSPPPSNSRGVTKAGTKSPSIVLTLRIWPNLFAFARCRQFQVTRKSHLW